MTVGISDGAVVVGAGVGISVGMWLGAGIGCVVGTAVGGDVGKVDTVGTLVMVGAGDGPHVSKQYARLHPGAGSR